MRALNNIVVIPEQDKDATIGGILIPKSSQGRIKVAQVVSAPDGIPLKKLDRVLYFSFLGTPVNLPPYGDCLFLEEEEIYGLYNEAGVPIPYQDYVFFAIEKEFEDIVGSIMISHGHTSYEASLSDAVNSQRRIYGDVLAIPMKYSDQIVTAIDPGVAPARTGIDGAFIEYQRKYGLKKIYDAGDYYPSTYKPKFITRKDIAKLIDIKPGERIYYDYKTITEENRVGRILLDKWRDIYKVRCEEILCTVNGEGLKMQGGWALVEKDMQKWSDITSETGIILQPYIRKKAYRGFVRYIREGADAVAGDHIIYHFDADWPVTVEEKEYFAIKESDILAVIESGAEHIEA